VSDSPLGGIRVIAFEQAVAMPFCSFVLAEMGADVIKLERPPDGDVLRGWDDAVRGLSSGFVWVNAGKRDVAVDVQSEAGREVVLRLARGADVFLENFSPGVADRLGFSPGMLRAENPRLVYCSISGYGTDGPYRDRKAYDLLVQGETGLILTTGYPDSPAKVGIPITDLVAGTNAALGVVMALYERQRSGEGAHVDVAMFDSILAWLGYYPQHYWHQGTEPPRSGMRHQYLYPYGPYLAKDGRYVNLVVASDRDWKRFCERVVFRSDWLEDQRFATSVGRNAHRQELEALLEEQLSTETSEVWCTRLEDARLGYGAVRNIGEVLAHPQVEARRLVVEADSEVGSLPLIRFPFAPVMRARRVPSVGQDTEEVLAEAGYSAPEIARLCERGVIWRGFRAAAQSAM